MLAVIVLCVILAYVQMKWLEDREECKQQKTATFWVQVTKQRDSV